MWDSGDVAQKYPKSWLPKIAGRNEYAKHYTTEQKEQENRGSENK